MKLTYKENTVDKIIGEEIQTYLKEHLKIDIEISIKGKYYVFNVALLVDKQPIATAVTSMMLYTDNVYGNVVIA